jgi:molybdopterin converting factor small subunit
MGRTEKRNNNLVIMEVNVFFLGVLSEVTGTGKKTYTGINTTEELRTSLFKDYPELERYKYNIALNNRLIRSDIVLSDGDGITLIPPFEGG